jgi:hypothetical protein
VRTPAQVFRSSPWAAVQVGLVAAMVAPVVVAVMEAVRNRHAADHWDPMAGSCSPPNLSLIGEDRSTSGAGALPGQDRAEGSLSWPPPIYDGETGLFEFGAR